MTADLAKRAARKSLIMLVAMMLIGVSLGVAGTLLWNRHARPPRGAPDGRNGFVAHLESVIAPHDSVQRALVRPILEATDLRNRNTVELSRQQMHANLDSMVQTLAPVLDAEQLARTQDLVQGLDGPPPPAGRGPSGPGGPGRGGAGRGGPPPPGGMPGPPGGPPQGPPPSAPAR